MKALDRIKAQAAAQGPLTVSVPEWGEDGEPLVIHYRRVTLNDVAGAVQVAPTNTVRQNVEVFCMIAQNPDGSPLFQRIDALALMELADPAVIGRVMREMGIIRTPDADAIEKN